MFLKRFTMACAAAALLAAPSTRATADTAGGLIAGAIIGGLVGHEVARNKQRQQRVVRRTYRQSSGISQAQRAENREVQTSLNYFGFPVGGVDGSLGRRSRAAISDYQLHLGYPVTGYLTDYEKSFLLGSYRRALAGGALTNQQIAANAQGPRGLLHVYRDEAAGIRTTGTIQPAAAATVIVAPQPAPAPAAPVTVEPATTAVAASPLSTLPVEPEPQAEGALPNFFGQATAVSLASHCNQINLLTSTNGGFATVETMTDPNQALNEQFCLARTYAISDGEKKAASIEGFSPQQINAQCEGFGPPLKEHVAALSIKPRDEVVRDVSNFVLQSGLAPSQLIGTAKICLSVGYRTDNMDVALGSALLLTALGDNVYGELMGHHLAQGYGVAKRTDLSIAWFEMGLTAVENGAVAVFAPGQPERSALIRKATFSLDGARQGGIKPLVQPTSTAALPTLPVNQ